MVGENIDYGFIGNKAPTSSQPDVPIYPENGMIKGGISNTKEKTNSKLSDNFLTIFNDYKGLEDPQTTALYVLGDFLSNYLALRDANTIGADKYFHAKANFEAAQQGVVGSLVAKVLSDLREASDSFRNVKEKGLTSDESKKDVLDDQNANEIGRKLGRENPRANAYEILKFLMPNGLPDRYKRK